MSKKSKNQDLVPQNTGLIDEAALFSRVSEIIENRKFRAQSQANQEGVLMFWEIGKYISSVLLGGVRDAYGKQIVVPLAQQLSWSHFIALLPIKSDEAFMLYANDAVKRSLGKRELRRQISRKACERREIANSQISEISTVLRNMFKDLYLLDILGLRENYLEADLEKAMMTRRMFNEYKYLKTKTG